MERTFPATTIYIQTANGELIDLLNLKEDDITIYDIATSLAHTCMGGGHVKKMYTNAQHSLLVSHYAGLSDLIDKSDKTAIWTEQLRGLLHDAAEVYLFDIRSPMKKWHGVKDILELDDKISKVITSKFGLDNLHSPAVKQADTLVRAQEMRDFMAQPKYKLPETDIRLTQKPFNFNIKALDPKRAKEEFLKRFAFLQREKP